MTFKVASVDSLIIYFQNEINEKNIIKIKTAYIQLKDIEGVIDIIPSYSSIFITYDIFKYSYETLCEKIKTHLCSTRENTHFNPKLLQIKVYYGTEVGLDLNNLSKKLNLSINDIINLHTSPTYLVYAIGFAPGFAFLAHVHSSISVPRLSTPRKIIKKGSVAIAEQQTAIYPEDSPGGWNIIGKSTFKAYDKNLASLTPFEIGDKVKFISISRQEFLDSGGLL